MQAAVAAGHELTTQAAMDIMKRGGNAFDGVLAAMMMSCVSEPVLASPGGGGYMMARDGSRGEVMFYDFFVQTPGKKKAQEAIEFYAAHADFGSVSQEFHIGAGAAAVPGLLPGFFAIQSELCQLKTADIMISARNAAQNGVKLTEFQAYLHSVIKPILTANREVQSVFLPSKTGDMPVAGDEHINLGLASLFEDMARQGKAICQTGRYASGIVEQSSLYGGHICQADLERYQVKKSKPLKVMFQGYEIYLPPPPAAGGTLIAFGLLLIDKLVQERDLKELDLLELVQVMEQTHQARASDEVLGTDAVSQGLKAIQKRKVVGKGTTHISIIDASLNIASLTLTNGEGNGRLVGDYGFMLNNMLGEEDLHPAGFHNWQEGQRLSSMMAPTIMKSPDGVWTALGSGGSNRIRTAILQVIINQVLRKMTLQQAIDLARIHAEKCGTISFEFSAALEHFTKQELDALATAYPDIHNWQQRNVFFGGVHCVSGGGGRAFEAAADRRRSGCSIVL